LTLRRRVRSEAGYSLIELLTVMMIMGVVLGGVTEVFVAATKGEADLGNRFSAQQNSRLGLEKIRRDIHFACAGAISTVSGTPNTYKLSLTSPASGGCPVVAPITYVNWCTVSVTTTPTRLALYRQTGTSTTCGVGGTKIADYLTVANAFPVYNAQSIGSLASAAVDFAVSVKGTSVGAYKLQDMIYLRNSHRCDPGTC